MLLTRKLFSNLHLFIFQLPQTGLKKTGKQRQHSLVVKKQWEQVASNGLSRRWYFHVGKMGEKNGSVPNFPVPPTLQEYHGVMKRWIGKA